MTEGSSSAADLPLTKVIYFGCSMLGGCPHVSREILVEFPRIIKSLGYQLASEHQTCPGVIEAEACLNPTYIHDRDYAWLLESHAGIFEISNPSLGVGAEISDMIRVGKPVLMLYQEELESLVSAYIRGKCGSRYVKSPVVCRSYRDMAMAEDIVAEFMAGNLRSTD
jgi:2'-deoxynucleoside 5'-phosphate N-hydrolase